MPEKSKRRILIVDDEASFRTLMEDFLATQGYETETAEDGRLGFRKAMTGNYDLVLADINMPGLNGVEAIRSIRTVFEKQRIVVLSGYLTPEVVEECRQAGAQVCMGKPVRLDELARVISRTLEDR